MGMLVQVSMVASEGTDDPEVGNLSTPGEGALAIAWPSTNHELQFGRRDF